MRGPQAGRGAGGLTVLELLLGLVLLSLVLGLPLPRFRHARLESAAAAAAADLESIRAALIRFEETRGAWPEDAPRGRIPAGLETLLPEQAVFTRDGYSVDYENWSGQTNGFVALSVATTGETFRDAILVRFGELDTWTDGPTGFRWVILWQ